MFITKEVFTGDLGGRDGAREKCANAARDAALPGTFVALLGFDDRGPFTAIPDDVGGPWINTKGEMLFPTRASFKDGPGAGSTDNNVFNRDERGQLVEPNGCNANGMCHCIPLSSSIVDDRIGAIWMNSDLARFPSGGRFDGGVSCHNFTSVDGIAGIGATCDLSNRWSDHSGHSCYKLAHLLCAQIAF